MKRQGNISDRYVKEAADELREDVIVQEPDRTISLQLNQDGWKVVNEGY